MNEPKVRILTQNEIIDFPTLLDILKDNKTNYEKISRSRSRNDWTRSQK